jgi:hypothetical protein
MSGEVSKFVTRNLFGGGFLETFSSVMSNVAAEGDVSHFFKSGLSLLRSGSSFDRTRRNIGAFLLAGLHLAEDADNIAIDSIEMDEVRVVSTSAAAVLSSILINQLDARGADIARWSVADLTILTMIVDSETRVPNAFCIPQRIVIVAAGSSVMEASPDLVSEWLAAHSPNPPKPPEGLLPERLRDHPAVKLLQKACRIRQYWLRAGGDDRFANKILYDDNWKLIERLLLENNLLAVDVRDASGTNARFYHIKYADRILSEDRSDPEIVAFYRDLVGELTAR